jgi:hypothetical protein
LAAVAVAGVASAPVHADTIALVDGGGWYQFYFGAPDFGNAGFQDAVGNPLDFSFTLTKSTILRIVDGGFSGDQFDVSVNGVDKGLTSTPVFAAADVEYGPFSDDHECFSCAFFDPAYNTDFSHGAYLLGPGTYDVTGAATLSPFFSGAAGISLGAVPEPATWAMMLTGFFGLGAALRLGRRRQAAIA